MIDGGKRNLVGVMIDAVDYEAATARIVDAARAGRPYGVSALAVHGVMEGVADPELRYRLNDLEMVTADGQAVRWALNVLHDTGLPDRCYGPTLMLRVLEAARDELAVFLYGSEPATVSLLEQRLVARFPGLQVAGSCPSRFATVSPTELDRIARDIRASGAHLVFVGLGCPRQEVFAYEMRHRLSMPVVAVGAAFDYHAGVLSEPPGVVQRMGMQWLWRLVSEPRRLWRRYYRTNPAFLRRVLRQRLGWEPPLDDVVRPGADLGHA